MFKKIRFSYLLVIFLVACLGGCTGKPTPSEQSASKVEPDAFSRQIDNIIAQINNDQFESAQQELTLLEQQAYNSDQHSLIAYARATLQMAQCHVDEAYRTLNSSETRQQLQLASLPIQVKSGLLNAELLARRDQPLAAARLRIYLAPLLTDEATYLDNHQRIWALLNRLDIKKIDLSRFKNEQVLAQWLKLNKIVQSAGDRSLPQQLAAIDNWMQQNPWHPAARNPPDDIDKLRQAVTERPQKIAVILPLDGKFRRHGVAIRDGLMRAYFQSGYKPELTFYAYDESPGFIDIYHEAVYDGADLVIGPLFKEQLKELYHFEHLPVPTLALNHLDDIPADAIQPDNLYQFSLSIDDEIDSIIELASAWHHEKAIVINQDSDWANRESDRFVREWQNDGHVVLSRASIDKPRDQSGVIQQALNIDKSKKRYHELQWLTGVNLEFEPRRRQDIDMIMLLARPDAAGSIRPLLSFHYAGDIPIYATSSVYRGYSEESDKDLNGIRFTDIPFVIHHDDPEDDDYRQSPLIRFHAFGMDAFSLTERLMLMAELPQLTYYGATGRLRIENHTIRRQTDFAFFSQGKVKPISIPAEQAASR